MTDAAFRGRYAFVEVARDPTSRVAWSAGATNPDRCECLLASSHLLYVFSLGEGMVNSALRVSRMLKVEERALLQGLPASIGQLPFEEAVGNMLFAMQWPCLCSGPCLRWS